MSCTHRTRGAVACTKPVHKTFAYNCSQILSSWLGDIVDSGIGLSYRPATSLCSLTDRYDNPIPESSISPSQD